MPGLSITALCVPAREVGGDYYDFLRLDEHRLGVLIADVSGKGTSAALYMAELKGLMLSLSQIHSSPRELLIQANRLIAEHLDARSFITMTYAVDRPGGRDDDRTRAPDTRRSFICPVVRRPAASRGFSRQTAWCWASRSTAASCSSGSSWRRRFGCMPAISTCSSPTASPRR